MGTRFLLLLESFLVAPGASDDMWRNEGAERWRRCSFGGAKAETERSIVISSHDASAVRDLVITIVPVDVFVRVWLGGMEWLEEAVVDQWLTHMYYCSNKQYWYFGYRY